MQEEINPKQTEQQRYVKRKEVGLEEGGCAEMAASEGKRLKTTRNDGEG
jgi:hypothetical protein